MRIDNPLLFGSLRTSGSFLWQASGSFTGSFTGDGSNLTGIVPDGLISSSAQIADAISGSINSLTSSFFTSASVALNTITFTQADGTTSALTINTGSVVAGGSGAGFPFSGDAEITGSLYVSGGNISGSFVGDGSGLTGVTPDSYQLITVTVASGKFKFDGATAPELNLVRGITYRFDTSDPSCVFNQLGFRTRNNTTYSTGVSIVGTAGSAGSYTEIYVRFDTPIQLRYYSIINGNSFGNLIAVADQFNAIYENGIVVTGSAYITQRIGVNTTTPSAQLHIKSSTEDVIMILEADTDNNNENDNPKIVFRQDGGVIESEIGLGGFGAQYTDALDDAAFFGSTTNSPLQFITNDIARITILGNGNVGINEKSPDTPLHVGGAISASVFYGDGSNLTGITAGGGGSVGGAIAGAVTSSFSNTGSISITHNFNSRQIIVSAYDTSYNEIIPQTVTLTDLNTVNVQFGVVTSGNLIVTRVGEPRTTYKQLITGSNNYTVTHNLNEDYPLVQVYESGSKIQVLPETVKSLTSSSLQINFNLNFDGHVIIKK